MKEKKEINVEIGRNIQRERERAGYTQERFSDLIGLEVKSLSSAERGINGISMTTLRQICTVLSIPADRILFGETKTQDAGQISERLERLSPKQFEIAVRMLNCLLEGFALQEDSQG